MKVLQAQGEGMAHGVSHWVILNSAKHNMFIYGETRNHSHRATFREPWKTKKRQQTFLTSYSC